MGNFTNLKSEIQQVVYQNTNKDISGEDLQEILLAMVEIVGETSGFMGVLSGSNKPTSSNPDGKQFYIAFTDNEEGVSIDLTDAGIGTLNVTSKDIFIVYADGFGWHTANIAEGVLASIFGGDAIESLSGTDKFLVQSGDTTGTATAEQIKEYVMVAATDADNEIKAQIASFGKPIQIDLDDYKVTDSTYMTSQGVWHEPSSKRTYALIPATGGDKFIIKANASRNNSIFFLKDRDYSNGQGNRGTSVGDSFTITQDTESEFFCPAGTELVYFLITAGGNDYTPQSVRKYGNVGDRCTELETAVSSLSEGVRKYGNVGDRCTELETAVSSLSEGVADANAALAGIEYSERTYDFNSATIKDDKYINGSSGEESESSAGYKVAVIYVEGYDKVVFKGVKTRGSLTSGYCFCGADDDIISCYTYINNTGLNSTFSEYTLEVPVGAKYFKCTIVKTLLGGDGTWHKNVFFAKLSKGKTIVDLIGIGETISNFEQGIIDRRNALKLKAEFGTMCGALANNETYPEYQSCPQEGGWEVPPTIQHLNVIRKARQMSNIRWTPKANMVKYNTNDVYTGKQTGVNYSSNSDFGKYVGLGVSLHTYMTAINNPYSLMYTENLSKSDGTGSAWGFKYHANKAGAWYGATCCGFAQAITGMRINRSNGAFPRVASIDGLLDVVPNYQDPQMVRIGDILNSDSHSIVIVAVHRTEGGKIDYFGCAESAGGTTLKAHQFGMTLEEYNDKITQSTPFILYRNPRIYLNTDYMPSPYVPDDTSEPQPSIQYNNLICTFAGDQATFKAGDFVVINYDLAQQGVSTYHGVELEIMGSNGAYSHENYYQFSNEDINSAAHVGHALKISDLSAGVYRAYLCTSEGGIKSQEYTDFEVLPNDVQVSRLSFDCYRITSNAYMMSAFFGYREDNNDTSHITNGSSKLWGRELTTEEADEKEAIVYPLQRLLKEGLGSSITNDLYVRVQARGIYGAVNLTPVLVDERNEFVES